MVSYANFDYVKSGVLSLVLTCRKNRKNRGFFIYRRPSGMRFPNRNDSDSSDHIGDSLGHCFYHVTLVVKIPGDRGPENPRFLRFLRQVRTRLYANCDYVKSGVLRLFSSNFFYARVHTYARYASMNEFTCSEHSVRIRT